MTVNSTCGLFSILFLFFISSLNCLAQDCPYDLNGDGIINCGDDLFIQLTQFGTADEQTDYNENGVSDMRDLLEMLAHKGYTSAQSCATEPEPEDISDHILGVILEEFHVHETALISFLDTIPAGAITYRLYLEVLESADLVTSIFGDVDAPMSISTPGTFYQTEQFGSAVPPANYQINSSIIPTLSYDSWFSLDDAPEVVSSYDSSTAPIGTQGWDSFLEGNDILIEDLVGGGVFNFNYLAEGDTFNDNLRLLGQFTLIDSDELSGQFNVQIQGNDFLSAGQASLSFNMDNLVALGCTDADASNFDPQAQYDDGSCLISGDFDGDGVVSINDILDLLTNFPCTEDCGAYDINGDGVVNVFDILLILGFL